MAEAELLRGGIGDVYAEFRKFPGFSGHEFESQAFDVDYGETVAAVCDVDLEPAKPGDVERPIERARE